MHPQENGNRRDVRWARFRAAVGPDVLVRADGVVDLTARRWTSEDLDRAAHTHELVPGDRVWVNVDAGQNGLGSASCGPGVLPGQRLLARTFDLGLSLQLV